MKIHTLTIQRWWTEYEMISLKCKPWKDALVHNLPMCGGILNESLTQTFESYFEFYSF